MEHSRISGSAMNLSRAVRMKAWRFCFAQRDGDAGKPQAIREAAMENGKNTPIKS
jgi:hypothetical protein